MTIFLTSRIFETGTARKEYAEIVASGDASIKTKFKFAKPLVLDTNKSYAVAVAYDGSEEYVLWTCKEGETLVKTNTITSGASAKNVGKYYQFTSDTQNWKSLTNVDLKFSVFACSYNANTSANTTSNTYVVPSHAVEYIMYNRYHPKTLNRTKIKIGEYVFQETPVIYGTVSVNAQSTSVTSTNNINFSTLFPSPPVSSGPNLTNDPVHGLHQYIVLRNGSTQAANVDVVKVKVVNSNTQIILDRLPVFTNNTASFSIAAAGLVEFHDKHFHTGRWFDWADQHHAEMGRS
jgi:hypothetical protein